MYEIFPGARGDNLIENGRAINEPELLEGGEGHLVMRRHVTPTYGPTGSYHTTPNPGPTAGYHITPNVFQTGSFHATPTSGK